METDGELDQQQPQQKSQQQLKLSNDQRGYQMFIEAMDTQEVDSAPPIVHRHHQQLQIHVQPQLVIGSQEDDENMEQQPSIPTISKDPQHCLSDQHMEDEEMRSEATFQFRVENFSKLKESTLSPPYFVRNLPWKIMVMPRSSMSNDRNPQETRALGFFLQCNGESDSSSWSCNALAELRLHSFKPDQEPFCRKIKHLFYSKENDWGFSHFMAWNEILDPEKGYIINDTIVLEVHVQAEAPHGVFWDSKKHTGYVGLKNQGATCYMNSLLQTLYFTNQLRKAVYKMPTEADDSSKSVALALQRVFHDLQFTDKPVGTKKLTKSFGWETLDSFMQHDVQEFLRVLLDKLESKMKGTCVEGTVPRLFEGKMSSYIKCKMVEYTSTRIETFYDIQLNIKGKKNIDESFKDYIATELLDGDNKYDAGEHGLQDAEKGVIFVTFPPVLHLHLMRFQYDPITDNSVKFNDRFEFYEHINLDAYLQENESTTADYTLHAVLVHSGDNHGGHYVVYINPLGDGKWCKFDDDVVSRCTKVEAIDHNFGGIDDDLSLNAKHCSNAYMLVYIRDSAMPAVLEEINESDIPTELGERLQEEKRMETVRRRDRNEANSFMSINVLLEEYLEGHQTTDLFDLDRVQYRQFKMKKTQILSDLVQQFLQAFNCRPGCMRIWPLLQRAAQITRPTVFDITENLDKTIQICAEHQNPWTIFLELNQPDSVYSELPIFDRERDVLIFFKCYDPYGKRLNYTGFGYYNVNRKLLDLISDLNRRAGWPVTTELTLYEEQGANVVQKILNHTDTLEKTLKGVRDMLDGDVMIFEKRQHDNETLELPTCEDYFRDLLYRVEVSFIDKANPTDTGFTLELSQRMTYDQMARAVGQRINVDPYNIQFFKCQSYKDLPGIPLGCRYDGNLKDILAYGKPKGMKKLFYQTLTMNINELESKKQFKCVWLLPNMKDERELILYPNKNGTVKTLLEEAAKEIQFSEEGSGRLRIVEINSHKLLPGPTEQTPLEFLQTSSTDISLTSTSSSTGIQKFYRVEEIPLDEINLRDDEMLVSVAHFCREVYNTFGIPFFIRIRNGEAFLDLKERIKRKLIIADKEWEKYKFAVVINGRAEYVTDDQMIINIQEFKIQTQHPAHRPYIGLEHFNKTQKKTRFNYLEKAIKIYN